MRKPSIPSLDELDVVIAVLDDDEARYDPLQPRAPDGKWSSGGGGFNADSVNTGESGGDADDDDEFDSEQDGEFEPVLGNEGDVGSEEHAKAEEKRLMAEQEEYQTSLGEEEILAIESYTGGGYRSINKGLRGAPPPPIEEELGEDALAAVALDTVTLDSTIAGVPPTTKPITTFRGTSAKALGIDGNDEESIRELGRSGASFTDQGFVSTSLAVSTATSFGGGVSTGGNVTMEVRIPSGSRAMSMGRHSSVNLGGETEFEVVLPPGTRFNIVGTRKYGRRTVLVVDADTSTATGVDIDIDEF